MFEGLQAGAGRVEVADVQGVAVAEPGGPQAAAVVVDGHGPVEDLVPAVRVDDYRHLKQIYQVLQYGRPRRRWMLKSPMHIENLDALRTVFPDATIVWTHRDPVTVMASYCSLVEHGMAISVRPADLHGIGATWLELLSRSMTRGLAARAAIPREALVDVPYSWLGSEPVTGAPKLYESIGARWTDADAARLPEVTARPKGTRPHSYDLSRYGLTRADVETAFADHNALRAEADRA